VRRFFVKGEGTKPVFSLDSPWLRLALSETVLDIVNASSGRNSATDDKFPNRILHGRFDAGFTMGLLHKDLSIALGLGQETATPAPVSALCKELVASALATFGQDADHTEMARVLERLAGEELGGRE